jgi:hypothetical protein
MNKFVTVSQNKDGSDSVVFDPAKPATAGTLNLWRGWGVEPKQLATLSTLKNKFNNNTP